MKRFLTLGLLLTGIAVVPAQAMTPAVAPVAISQAVDEGADASIVQVRMHGHRGMRGHHNRGRHMGWTRGRHRGWAHSHRRMH